MGWSKKILVVDLETVPAPWWVPPREKLKCGHGNLLIGCTICNTELTSDEWLEAKACAEAQHFPPLPAHMPVVLGGLWVALQEGEHAHLDDQTTAGPAGEREWERAGLVKLGKCLRTADNLVTFNGRGFDMPLLQLRALALAATWEFWESKRHRFPNYRNPLFHLDLMDQLSDYGAARGIGLDNLAKMCGMPGKPGMDGGDVATIIQQEDGPELVANYCRHDLLTTLRIYIRLLYIRGEAGKADIKTWLDDATRWAVDAGLETTGSGEDNG